MDKRIRLGSLDLSLMDRDISIPVYLKKGSRKYITCRINYGQIELYSTSRCLKKDLVKCALETIQKYPDSIIDRPFMKEDIYIYMLGEKRYFTFDISLKDDTRYFYISKTCKDPIALYKKKFLSYLERRVQEIGKTMNLDLTDWTIRTGLFLTYHAVCFPIERQLKFDYRLFAYKEEIIDSIIIHELSHIYVRHHDKKFYSIVYKYCPDYEKLDSYIKKGYFEGDQRL